MWFEFTPSSVSLPPFITKIFFLVLNCVFCNRNGGRERERVYTRVYTRIRIEYRRIIGRRGDQSNRVALNRRWQLTLAVNCRDGTKWGGRRKREKKREREKRKGKENRGLLFQLLCLLCPLFFLSHTSHACERTMVLSYL